ncbi:hypothetical protein KY284_027232, partial [Solanum tuberosum]
EIQSLLTFGFLHKCISSSPTLYSFGYDTKEPVAQGGLLPSLMANKADEVYGLSSTNSNSVLLQKTPTVGARLPIVGKISTCNNQGVKVDAPGFKLDEATSHQQQVQEMEG